MPVGKIIQGASDALFGSSTIGDAIAKKKQQSPQYDFLWRVELPSLEQSAGDVLGSEGSFIDRIASNFMDSLQTTLMGDSVSPEDINHRVMSFDSPFFRFDTKRITDKNGFFYTASNREIGTISLTIHEMEDGGTLKYLQQWHDAIRNEDGTYNPPIMYKFPVRFYRMSATKLDLHSYLYDGFFISEIQTLSNGYESNGILSYNVTLTGDKIKHEFMSGSEVRTKVMSKELQIIGKQWLRGNTKLSGGGLTDVLRTAGGLSQFV